MIGIDKIYKLCPEIVDISVRDFSRYLLSDKNVLLVYQGAGTALKVLRRVKERCEEDALVMGVRPNIELIEYRLRVRVGPQIAQAIRSDDGEIDPLSLDRLRGIRFHGVAMVDGVSTNVLVKENGVMSRPSNREVNGYLVGCLRSGDLRGTWSEFEDIPQALLDKEDVVLLFPSRASMANKVDELTSLVRGRRMRYTYEPMIKGANAVTLAIKVTSCETGAACYCVTEENMGVMRQFKADKHCRFF